MSGRPGAPPPIDKIEMRVLSVLTIIGRERQMVSFGIGNGPGDGMGMCVGCALCKWYDSHDAPGHTGLHMALQHLMCRHMSVYDRAMFHYQRVGAGVGRDLSQSEYGTDATLDMLATRHAVSGHPGQFVFACADLGCRYLIQKDKAEGTRLMHEHFEVAHHDAYNAARRFVYDVEKVSEMMRRRPIPEDELRDSA